MQDDFDSIPINHVDTALQPSVEFALSASTCENLSFDDKSVMTLNQKSRKKFNEERLQLRDVTSYYRNSLLHRMLPEESWQLCFWALECHTTHVPGR